MRHDDPLPFSVARLEAESKLLPPRETICGGVGCHILREAGGGENCNYTRWECDHCGLVVVDTHEHEGGYIEIKSTKVAKMKCPSQGGNHER